MNAVIAVLAPIAAVAIAIVGVSIVALARGRDTVNTARWIVPPPDTTQPLHLDALLEPARELPIVADVDDEWRRVAPTWTGEST